MPQYDADDVDMYNFRNNIDAADAADRAAAAALLTHDATNRVADEAMQEADDDEDYDETESQTYSEIALCSSADERLPFDELASHMVQSSPSEAIGFMRLRSEQGTTAPRHPYPHLREISSLASWHVSSQKQKCGVAALRHPSTTQFWQSDGPQPHTLTIHFLKRVIIAHMRLHIDHELDESYTPTKLQVWAGCGMHDLIQATEVVLDNPSGWLDVDLSKAGGPSEFVEGEDDIDVSAGLAESRMHGDPARTARELAKRKERAAMGRGLTLRCMVVQVRILENYQNGKDTHLRGCQIFAKDHGVAGRSRAWLRDRQKYRQAEGEPPNADALGDHEELEAGADELTSLRHLLDVAARRAQEEASAGSVEPLVKRRKKKLRNGKIVAGIREADWMGEPVTR